MSVKNFFYCSLKLAILPIILIWPFLKWIFALDVFFQFLLIFINWNSPNTKSIIIFVLHFLLLTIFTIIVSSNETYKREY